MIPNLLRKYAFPATTRLETTKGIRKIPKMLQRKFKKDIKLKNIRPPGTGKKTLLMDKRELMDYTRKIQILR